MARFFDNTSLEALEVNTAAITAVPLSMAAWGRTSNVARNGALLSLVDSASGIFMFGLRVNAGSVGAFTFGVPAGFVESTTGSPVNNTWFHAGGVIASATSRFAYFNSSIGTENTQNATPSGINTTSIGRLGDLTPSSYMLGDIAEAAIWNKILEPAEFAALAAGFSPLMIRPSALVFYMPLIRDNDIDLIGGLSLSEIGTPEISDHPQIIYPSPPHIITAPAAGVTGNPWYQYQQEQMAGAA